MIVELWSVDPAANRARGYRVATTRTLFGEPCVKIQWGRIGQHWREKTELYPDDALCEQRVRTLVNLRTGRGYVAQRLFGNTQ